VAKLRLADMYMTCKLLLDQQQWNQVIEVLEVVWPSLNGSDDWFDALELIKRIPSSERLEIPKLGLLYARALSKNSDNDALLEFSIAVLERHGLARTASIQLERAGALISHHRYVEARATLEQTLLHLAPGSDQGLAWSRLGLALYHLEQPWRESYRQAKMLLSGEELGKALLNEGFCLADGQQYAEARRVWLESLPHFRSNPRMLAWTRYNLGITGLQDFDPEAERHFLEADRLTHNAKALTLRSAVLNGLAGSRRVFGEWARAESTYREALHAAADTHDQQESYLGLARTLRLAGRLSEALETLEFALSDATLEPNLFHVARAKVFLALNQNDHARQSLERVGHLVSTSDQWLERIARAELARRDGHLDQAVQLLEGLPVHTLHAREEVRQWPQLFQLLELAGKPVPLPLGYVQGTTVRVMALGVLRVTVNDRIVPIVPTGRVGELLVFLLEHGGAASLEVIAEALYPDVTHKRARKSIWMLVKFLRDALGWEGSVIALRGAYQLDPNVTWAYDMREARSHGAVQSAFLEGIYSNWALEIGRELEASLDVNRHPRELN
jgi:tetratricopeptide (TPR) repeat protein